MASKTWVQNSTTFWISVDSKVIGKPFDSTSGAFFEWRWGLA